MGKIDELFQKYTEDDELSPGIAIALTKNGKCFYKKYHGYSSLENKVKIDDKTNFYLASLSKSFTAAAIMLLYEKKLLDLSDKISKFFYNLPDCYKDIKIENLLNHTSGLRDYFDYYDENKMNINEITNNEVYGYILRGIPLNFQVGEKFEYSNTGYVLLSLLIEKISGKSYSEFLEENFFRPLDMANTFVYTERKPIIPNRAYGYSKIDNSFCCNDYCVLTTGDGGIYSCLNDILLWLKAFDEEVILKKATIEKVFTRNTLNDNTPYKYGFGWFVLEKNVKKVVYHTGGLAGFTNIMAKLPKENFSLVVLTNYYKESLTEFFNGIYNCVLEESDMVSGSEL